MPRTVIRPHSALQKFLLALLHLSLYIALTFKSREPKCVKEGPPVIIPGGSADDILAAVEY